MIDITTLQNWLPASIKNALKPHYRMVFPNKLHVILWITFRCNYRCSYCPVVTKFDFATVVGKDGERSPSDWIAAFDRLPAANIYISGGEPFLYRGLPDLINRLPAKHAILGVVSNATAGIGIYKEITKRIHLNLSFHREFVGDDDFLEKIEELRASKRFHLNVNLVATRENLPMIPRLERLLTDHNVSLHIDPFVDPEYDFAYTPDEMSIMRKYLGRDRTAHLAEQLDFADYSPKMCSAGTNYINVLPNGDVYTCASGFDYIHSPLKRKILERGPDAPYSTSFFKMGNLFEAEFHLNTEPVYCELPCVAACDRDAAVIKLL